ncbi:hypothetical protein BCR39DRAFT_518914 [Naematelia encephala]|uniref:TRIP4/RQT4 C2HC5-type zinc finger domain-containing protein n=1 Tax=Naematelia encephala TaxID=71784 RepID=A0A1Y2BG03_9TREE|nr:hypothetical protein BCR39DRAFT_518914 [Naematelia encephala]
MAIPPRRPAWVVSELSKILGFDEETVKEAILPELESNTHEARLRSYLQDFLGPSPASKAFIAKYVSFRFPSITSIPSSTPRPSSPLSLKPTSKSRARTQPATPQIQPRPADIDSALSAAFGPGGQIYQKNRDADDNSGWGSRSHSQNASGSRTPARQAGALSIHDKAKARVDIDGGGKEIAIGKGKGKDKEKIWDLPKSIATKRLERIQERLKEVQAGEGKLSNDDTSVECFCQARVHTLSPYTPQCPHCGLALCNIHSAHRPCPSCHRPILNPAQLARLILRIQDEISAQIAKEQSVREEVERQRLARLVAESGGGAFPTLSSGPSSTSSTSTSTSNARKVLSIGNNKRGKSTITTTTYRTSPSQAATPIEPLTPPIPDDIVPAPRMMPLEPARVEKEINKALAWREVEDRPWGDKKRSPSAESGGGSSVSSIFTSGIGAWEYVEEPVIGVLDEGHEGRRKTKKKGRGEHGRIVPGAAT